MKPNIFHYKNQKNTFATVFVNENPDETISVVVKSEAPIGSEGSEVLENVFECRVPIRDLRTDRMTKSPINPVHSVVAVTNGLVSEDGFVVVDVLRYTVQSKGSLGYMKRSLRFVPSVLFFIPFHDSPTSDWHVVGLADKFVFNGVDILDWLDVDESRTLGETCNALLPGLSLSRDGNSVSANLITPSGQPISKAGIEIYFESTTGSLSQSRAITDSNGSASVELINPASGKVKAGFKHFPGKAEVAA